MCSNLWLDDSKEEMNILHKTQVLIIFEVNNLKSNVTRCICKRWRDKCIVRNKNIQISVRNIKYTTY